MIKFIKQIPTSTLVILALFMLLTPFTPMPHIVEKMIMLKNGDLTKGIDIFDVFFHLIPTILLLLKLSRFKAVENKK